MSLGEREDEFQYWLADMDDAIGRFFLELPSDARAHLDFTPDSLAPLEAWLLSRYPDTKSMLEKTESLVVDGVARYVGEVVRRSVGGRWEMRLDDPTYVFYGVPQLAGFWAQATPICPLALATAAADRRTGRFISGVVLRLIKDKHRT